MIGKDTGENLEVFCYEMTTADIDAGGDMGYTTYGIRALGKAGGAAAHYPDVSTNRNFIAGLVKKCNDNQLDVLHLEDVILDHIG